MIYIAIILLLASNIGMAAYHSHLMKEEKKIEHGWWALAYLVLAGLLAYVNHSWLLLLVALLIRKVVFDISLNLFNGRKTFFVSTETTSIVDKIHYKIFRNKSWIYYGIYSIAAIILTILI